MIRARDVMKARVLTLGPDTTVEEATRLFEDAGISGAPVVGPGRSLLGVVSRADLLRRHQEAASGRVPPFYRDGTTIVVATDRPAPGKAPVSEVMTPAVLTAREDTPLEDLAAFMVRHRIHRVIVTRDGRLRGIVTTMDVLRVVAAGAGWPGGRGRASRRPSSRRRAAGRAS